ncbi:recombinase family protein [Clostridium sp.]|uniref:recombinase family protein n=1 Tax=Clostridium sp. TaxID=1506 RepID=UPI001D595D2C|nr:recombinase family protein [Clostridium sp.]MBS5308776.1 recombinase family protein [Clostridium sp.]
MNKVCIYLRKSRADEEIEKTLGQGETLAKHRKALLKYAKEKNLNIIEIKEEIVSGDSLFHRPKMLELLKEVENKQYTGVLVMDIDRLGRGGMKDQGIILDAFKESNTLIITPTKTYDLNDELDEEMTEFKTFFSRRELKTINRRMQGGRIRSVEDGNYIATNPPLGYDIEYIKKSRTLKINESESAVIKIIFDKYINGDGAKVIANYLNSLGLKNKSGKAFNYSSILYIIKNPIYIGKITWKKREYKKSLDISKKKDCRTRDKSEWIIANGKHEGIIEESVFNRANTILNSRYHIPYKQNNEPVNPFAGILKCGICKKTLIFRKVRHKARIMCIHKCGNISIDFDIIENRILLEMKKYLAEYKATIENTNNDTDNKRNDYSKQLSLLKKELTTLSEQRLSLFDYFERHIYTEDVFLERSKNIDERINNVNREIDKLNNLISDESIKENSTQITKFENVITGYENTDDIKLKNELLKSVLDNIEYIRNKEGVTVRICPTLLR